MDIFSSVNTSIWWRPDGSIRSRHVPYGAGTAARCSSRVCSSLCDCPYRSSIWRRLWWERRRWCICSKTSGARHGARRPRRRGAEDQQQGEISNNMFRIKNKKGSGGDPEQKVLAERREPVEQASVAKVPPRRTLPVAARPLGNPAFDITRRVSEAPAGARADPSSVRDKSLIIGRDVHLKGEIFACDKLVVEGDAEIALTGCRHLHLGAAGNFRRTAEVAE